LPTVQLDNEKRLEQWIADDVSLIGLEVLIIGRQVFTESGGFIDLLAIDRKGDLVLIELKRGKTPRDVVAQTLDYASWVSGLLHQQISEIGEQYLKKPLPEAFYERFRISMPEDVNNDHRMVIVASQLDDSSERIVRYLATNHSLNINVVFFTCFRQGKKEIVGRAWLLDPEEVEMRSEAQRSAPRTKKEGLRKPQARILEALAKLGPGKALDRQTLAENAGCDPAWMNSWLGAVDPEIRAKNDTQNGWISLWSLGFVKMREAAEGENKDGTPHKIRVYEITESGRIALDKYREIHSAK
jgi:hypothetical protein